MAAKNIYEERTLSGFFPPTLFKIAKFPENVPLPVKEYLPMDEAFELERKLKAAGLTVKVNGRRTYISYHKFSDYNEHQRDQLTNAPLEPEL